MLDATRFPIPAGFRLEAAQETAHEARGDEVYAGLPNVPPHARPRLKLIGKLVRPTTEEVERNPRSRSARLRIAERQPTEQAA